MTSLSIFGWINVLKKRVIYLEKSKNKNIKYQYNA